MTAQEKQTWHVVIWEDGSWFLKCHETPDAPCHAIWECGCESFTGYSVVGGAPQHEGYALDVDDTVIHKGKFDPSYCNIEEWFDAIGTEMVHGTIRVPVTVELDIDNILLHVKESK